MSEGDAGNDVVNIDSDGKLHTVPKANLMRGIDDTPVNGQPDESITSNWAYEHGIITGNGGHVPAAGSSGQFLAYNGTWATPPDTDTNTQLTDEQVQDIVGAMFSGNTETNITATYQDADGTIDLAATDTNTQLSNEEVRTAVEAASDSNVFTDADHEKLNDIAVEANNYSLPSANETTVGGVELATTGEADTGTDTSRAVTPAGLKSHVDARYTTQYINFSFKITSYEQHTWVSPHANGIEYYLWGNQNKYATSGTTQAASHSPVNVQAGSTLSIDYLDQGTSGFTVPYASQFVGFRGNIKLNSTDPTSARPVMGFFRAAEPSDRNNSDVTATVISFDKYDTSSGVNMKNRFLGLSETLSSPVALSAGDIIFPACGLDVDMNDTNGLIWGNFTVILRTRIV